MTVDPRAVMLVAALLAAGCASSGPKPRRVPEGHTGLFTTYHPSGEARESGMYTDGVRDGLVRQFHPDGSLAAVGMYRNGEPVGPHRRFHENGRKAVEEVFVDGEREGTRTEWHENGVRRGEVSFRDGEREGAHVEWYPSGLVRTQGRYAGDLKVGGWRSFDAEGRLVREVYHWELDGEPVGLLETVFDEDTRPLTQSLRVLDDGHWVGRDTLWHPNGHQAWLIEMRDGKRHGRDLAWDEDGVLQSEGRWRDDRRAGTWAFYDRAGVLRDTRKYDDEAEGVLR